MMRGHVNVHVVALSAAEVAILALQRLLSRVYAQVHHEVLRTRERLVALIAAKVASVLVRDAYVIQ